MQFSDHPKHGRRFSLPCFRFICCSPLRGGIVALAGLMLAFGAGCQETSRGQQAEKSVFSESDVHIRRSQGETMGTYYAVTVVDPPASFPSDWKEAIDLALREVNDQMSTYLEHSEISKFNASQSTDWFPVSAAFARVVDKAQEISRATDGAFDITVGPLVNAWSFGPGKRSQRPPEESQLQEIMQRIGYERLEVRLDPPALKKQLPELQIDLSAIAKGYGVDRLIEVLQGFGCENAFVDIGGEDRTIGRRGNRAWRVAVEDPKEGERQFHYAFELTDRAIATSGDYRNFFVYEGQRYSHTIDPQTGRPVKHQVALVSVLAATCMEADAWATALNVLGDDAGMRIAEEKSLAVRFVIRLDDGGYKAIATTNFPENILAAEE